MKLISFAIASIVDANTGYRQPTSGGQVDYVYAGKQGRAIRSHQLLALFGRLLGGLGGLVERSRAKAEQRRQLAELGALSDRSLRDIGLHRSDIHAIESGQVSLADLQAVRQLRSERTLQTLATDRLALPRASVNDPYEARVDCA